MKFVIVFTWSAAAAFEARAGLELDRLDDDFETLGRPAELLRPLLCMRRQVPMQT